MFWIFLRPFTVKVGGNWSQRLSGAFGLMRISFFTFVLNKHIYLLGLAPFSTKRTELSPPTAPSFKMRIWECCFLCRARGSTAGMEGGWRERCGPWVPRVPGPEPLPWYQWISTENHACAWLTVNIHGSHWDHLSWYQWISIEFCGYPWRSMDIHGYVFVLLEIQRNQWMSMEI